MPNAKDISSGLFRIANPKRLGQGAAGLLLSAVSLRLQIQRNGDPQNAPNYKLLPEDYPNKPTLINKKTKPIYTNNNL